MLNKEINLNKKVIVFLVLMCVLSIGMYSSYAYYEVSVIKNSVIVLKTASINITTTVVNQQNNTFTIPAGGSKTLTVNLTTELTNQIAYKMYYEVTPEVSAFKVTSTETFTNNIVEGDMTSSKSFSFTFTNTGLNDITIKLGTQGGLTGYPITLDQGIELKLNETLGVSIKDEITKSVNNPTGSCKTKVEEDGITYISGTSACIDFNYVWYSGKMWRITQINQDGTMKMVTDDNMTTISYGSNSTFANSYIYQWLNEDFLDTLYNYQDILVEDSTWNVTTTTSGSTKLPETTLVNKATIGVSTPVGLLNSYEYYMSYKNTNSSSGYLKNGFNFWLLNPYSSSSLWSVNNTDGKINSGGSSSYFIVRPAINLNSNVKLSSGIGTKSNPYRISGDNKTGSGDRLNTRTSGEYVLLNDELYRIVGIEDEKTKINKVDILENDNGSIIENKMFSASSTYGSGDSDEYWDYYLNNTWIANLQEREMLVAGTYYSSITIPGNYKEAICSTNDTSSPTKTCTKTNEIWQGYIGLPRYGEMFACPQVKTTEEVWTLNTFGSFVWTITSTGGLGDLQGYEMTHAARPSMFLSPYVTIYGGTGLPDDPFTIG